MTNFQFYLFAQVYGSGTYGGQEYQCTGDQCETQTDQAGVLAPSTGALMKDGSLSVGIIAAILLVSVLVAFAVVALRKRINKRK